MAIGTQVSLSGLQVEFGGSQPISLSSYYRGTSRVPNCASTAPVPTSGQISLSQFQGTQYPLWSGRITPAWGNDGSSNYYGYSAPNSVGSILVTGALATLSEFFWYEATNQFYVRILNFNSSAKVSKTIPTSAPYFGYDFIAVSNGSGVSVSGGSGWFPSTSTTITIWQA